MRPLKPTTYRVTSLSLALGVDQSQVSEWKRLGMPFDRNGAITLAVAVRWLREHERRERPRLGRSESDERRAAAEAELAELKLLRERADVVPAAAVLASAEDEASRVSGILSQMHTEFSPLVASELKCGLREASAVLRKISDGVRARLAAQDDTEQESAA